MKKVQLRFDSVSNAWIHDGSGLRFLAWSEKPEEKKEQFEKIKAIAKERLATWLNSQIGASGGTYRPGEEKKTYSPADIDIQWGALSVVQSVPLTDSLRDMVLDTPHIDADADPAASTAPLLKNHTAPKRSSVA